MSIRKNDTDGPDSGDVEIAEGIAGMSSGDRIALAAIAAVFFAICFGAMLFVRWILSTFFGMFDVMDQGVGLRAAFLTGFGLSLVTILLFTIVAGEGVVGELPTMIIGFFIMMLFFTLSIAFVF